MACEPSSLASETASGSETEAEPDPETEPAAAESETEVYGGSGGRNADAEALEAEFVAMERERREAIERFIAFITEVDPDWLTDLYCEDYGVDCSLEEHAGFHIATTWNSGSGVDAAHFGDARVYRDGALVVRALKGATDGAYVSTITLEPSTPAAIEAYARAIDTRWTSTRDVERSRAELFLSARESVRTYTSTSFSVRGPLYHSFSNVTEEECTSDGDTQNLPDIYVRTERALRDVWFFQWDEPVDRTRRERFMRVARVLCTNTLEQRVGQHRVRVYQLLGRNQGVAIAVQGSDGKFRWALETRNAVLGSDVRWVGAQQGWIFGYTRSHHPGHVYLDRGALFAIRVSDGIVAAIDVPDEFEEGAVGFSVVDAEFRVEECAAERIERAGYSIEEASRQQWRDASVGCLQDIEVRLDAQSLRITRPNGRERRVSTPALLRILNQL